VWTCEVFIRMRLEALGHTVHFVDTWYYHIRLGEIHCGTNILHQKNQRAREWWTLDPL
jgi:hypothetical protein